MSIEFGQTNFWAVGVAAVASFLVGGLWYGLLFAKAWPKMHGFTEEQQQQLAKDQPRNFALFFVGDLVMATVVSFFAVNLGIASWTQGALLGFVLWLGIAATIGASKNAATGKTLAVHMMDTTHELVCLVAMGAIVGAWR